MGTGSHGRDRGERTSQRGRPLARFKACPKCRGQYLLDGWTCHCYQCCFEWDLRDPIPEVLARARRMYRGEPAADSLSPGPDESGFGAEKPDDPHDPA